MKKEKEENIQHTFQYVIWKEGENALQQDYDKKNYLVFLISGEIQVIYGGITPRKISEGNMLLLPASVHWQCNILTETETIILEFGEIDFICDKFMFQNLEPIYSLIKYEFKELKIDDMLNEYLLLLKYYHESGFLHKKLIKEKIKELFIIFKAYYNVDELTMLFYPLLGKNMEFKKKVVENYSYARSATEYADLFDCSLSVFQRKFKDVFGETVYQWMQRQKAEHIKHCLMISDINPKNLAEEFGFTSPAHLNKFCKIWFEMTPSELRQTYLLKKQLK